MWANDICLIFPKHNSVLFPIVDYYYPYCNLFVWCSLCFVALVLVFSFSVALVYVTILSIFSFFFLFFFFLFFFFFSTSSFIFSCRMLFKKMWPDAAGDLICLWQRLADTLMGNWVGPNPKQRLACACFRALNCYLLSHFGLIFENYRVQSNRTDYDLIRLSYRACLYSILWINIFILLSLKGHFRSALTISPCYNLHTYRYSVSHMIDGKVDMFLSFSCL